MEEFNYREFIENTLLPENENLKCYLKDKGMSGTSLAEKAYCIPRTMNRYIRGDNKIPSDVAESIAKALDISVEELTGKNTLLEHGIKKQKDKVIQRAMKIAKALNKSVNDLTSQDLQSNGGIEQKEINEIDAEKEFMEILKQVLEDNNLNTLSLISNNKKEIMQIYGYDWTCIQQFLNLSDSDLDWIKEVMFHYFVWSDIFVKNIRRFNEFLYEIINVLNYEENKNEKDSRDIFIKALLEDSDMFMNKLKNVVENMKHMGNIREEIWEMLVLFAKIHECRE